MKAGYDPEVTGPGYIWIDEKGISLPSAEKLYAELGQAIEACKAAKHKKDGLE